MANYSETGYTGLTSFSGQVQEDFLKELRGKEGYKRFNEMRLNSPIVGALLFANEQAIRKVSWNFTSDAGEEDPRIELLEAARDSMSLSWGDHITEVLTMLPFGYSIFEIVYKRDESGRVLWRKFAPRGQDTVYQWQFDKTGGLAGVTQMAAPQYKIISLPIEKLIVYRTRVEKGNPEGRSLLRAAWIPYFYVKNLQQVEAIGFERDANGMPVIKMPEGASVNENDKNSDASKAAKIVRNVRNDEQSGVTLPFGWDLLLLSGAGKSFADIANAIQRYKKDILTSTLSQFLMLGMDGMGSYSLSKDITEFFTMSTNATADIISETFTKYAIPRLLKLNGYDAEGIRLEHTPAGDTDVAALADTLQKLGAMVTWDANDEVWLRGLIGLPERDAGELEAERSEKEARDAEIARNITANKKDDEEQEDMSAEIFASRPHDERKRIGFEREWQRRIARVLTRQKNKVIASAKGLLRA